MSPRSWVAAALLALACTPAAAVQCDFSIDSDTRIAHNGDLVMSRDGAELVRMTDEPALLIEQARIELNDDQRAAVTGYRDAHAAIVDEAKLIGLAGAKLGGKAAYTVLVGLLTGTADRAEAKIEAEAAELEARAESLCVYVEQLRVHHESLSASIPEFAKAVPIQ
ncbi:MAG: DUF2884 family protein [Gammaproteobacteria bacterium]